MKTTIKTLSLILGILLLCGAMLCGCDKSIGQEMGATPITVDTLLAEGKYAQAYGMATGSKKTEVANENLVAYISYLCVNSLKDEKSFDLREAWVNHGDNDCQIILRVAANNTYGNTVINYWFFAYDLDEKTYDYMGSYADLSEEETYDWQDMEEKIEIIMDNAFKKRIKTIISDSTLRLASSGVKNINGLFAKGVLGNVDLLPVNQ